jgi:hypothetical protein
MSSSIEIKTDGCNTLCLDIQSTGVEFEAWKQDAGGPELITMFFDLRDKEDKEALQKLVSHLQHQLKVHEENK